MSHLAHSRRAFRIVATLLACGVIAACGFKGPLYLPPAVKAPKPATATTKPATATPETLPITPAAPLNETPETPSDPIIKP